MSDSQEVMRWDHTYSCTPKTSVRIKVAVYPEGVKCKRETHKIRRLQKRGKGDLTNAYRVSKKVLTRG